jgi:D-sedoheptulose 7-phosphate isomerase
MAVKNLASASYVTSYLDRLGALLKKINPVEVERVGALLCAAREEGRQVFLCGNGGSAAMASHIAVDLGKGASRNRPKRFRVISFTDNVPWMTALSNDVSYEDVFVEQLKNYADKGDILIAISSSGNSKNVLKAVEYANQVGCETVGLSGFKGGKLAAMCKHNVVIPAEHMGLIEDGQMVVGHILVYAFMETEGAG